MLEAVKCNNESLLDIIKDKREHSMLSSFHLLTYTKDSTEYSLSVKAIKTSWNKEICNTILMHDQTPFTNLVKLEEKYQKVYLASVVHDIRTPIQGVLGMLEMLDTPEASLDVRQVIQVGRDTCRLLIFLTHDITDLAQIAASKLQIREDSFCPSDVVEECMRLLAFSFEKKRIRLSKLVSHQDIFAYTDKHRYMQIVLNLLGNALKFTMAGSVTVKLDYDTLHDMLQTEVVDTGIGIQEEDLDKLFKLFGRIDTSSSLNPQGVGLGLTICKKLAEAMGGTIKVASRYGRGSSFTFSIKCNTQSAPTAVLSRDLPTALKTLPPLVSTSHSVSSFPSTL